MNNGILTPQEMGQKLRNQLLHKVKQRKGLITYGTFGPTFKGLTKGYFNNQSNKEAIMIRKRKRGRNQVLLYKVCEKLTCWKISECWYTFPDRAPEKWKLKENLVN